MLVLIGLLVCFKHDYIFGRFIFWIGILFIPFIVRQISVGKSTRYGILSLLSGSVLFFENSNMAYYFCCGFGLLFIWEIFKGRLNNLPFFLLVIISPVFQYVSEIWSFPIRMRLSDWAGSALSLIGKKAAVVGNVVLMDGNEFLVDSACMGLDMMSVSLLLVLVFMARKERQRQFFFPFFEICGWLLLTLLLSIFSNFNRLLALVMFKVLPDNPMHDIWGIVALFVFVLIPIFYLLEWRCGHLVSPNYSLKKRNILPKNIFSKYWAMPYFFIVPIFFILFFNGENKKAEIFKNIKGTEHISLSGFKKSSTDDGMLKLESDSALAYIKPPAGFLRASHDPRICWRGSGYTFKQVQKENINGVSVYIAKMEKVGSHLYTAWWYDNGHAKTIEEWQWRWAGLLGRADDFYLVNVTCGTKMGLKKTTKDIINALHLKE